MSGISQSTAQHIGPWRLGRMLGRGRWCEVHAARPAEARDSTPFDYAVKRIRPECSDWEMARGMLRREAQIGRTAANPHLATVLSADVSGDSPYVVLPLAPGRAISTQYSVLSAQRKRGGHRVGYEADGCVQTLSRRRAFWFARQAAVGLAALHDAGWVHADLNPDNLLVAADGHVTIIDLGLAVPVNRSHSPPAAFHGSLQYAAPEWFTARPRIDGRSDVYSLGVMLASMLTGQPSFDGTVQPWSAPRRRQRAATEQLERANLPANVVRLVQEMLATQPIRRPSAAEVAERLYRAELATLADAA